MSDMRRKLIYCVNFATDDKLHLKGQLEHYGFEVSSFVDIQTFFSEVPQIKCDLLILNIESKSVDLYNVSDLLRQNAKGSRYIILLGESDIIDRVLALELGADDVLSSDTDPREILARVRALLRRPHLTGSFAEPSAKDHAEQRSTVPSLRFERVQRCLHQSNGRKVDLTTAEFNLLSSFADHVNVPLARDQLYELVYHRRWSAYDRTLDTLVAKLRRKIERDPQNPDLIKTVHGTGYIFTGLNFS